MRLLVLSQFWYPENGVPQRRWTWLSSIFANMGGEISVVAPPPNYRRKLGVKDSLRSFVPSSQVETGPAGEEIYRSPFLSAGESLLGRAFSQAFIASGALMVVARNWAEIRTVDAVVGTVPALPTAVVSFLVARVFRVPYVIDLRDAWPDLMKEHRNWNRALEARSRHEEIINSGPIRILSWIVEKGLNALLERADAIIVTSEDLAEKLRSQRSKYLTSQNQQLITTIRNVFPANTPTLPKRHSFDFKTLRVLYAGTLGRAQNLRNSIDAAAIAQYQGTPVELVFVGGGAAAKELEKYAALKGVNASFYRVRSAAELVRFYEWADTALVHLTDWEPLDRAVPSKTYELMSLGIHISGVVNGETARIIESLEAGDTVEPENPHHLAELWTALFNDPARLSVTAKGRMWVESERETVVPGEVKKIVRWVENLK
mgnify:CR=1 FL=1